MDIEIRSFAMLREIIGVKSLTFEINEKENTITHVLNKLIKQYPELMHFVFKNDKFNPNYVVALNKKRLYQEDFDTTLVKSGDEVAILPPAGGG